MLRIPSRENMKKGERPVALKAARIFVK
jgi:hypothetical protein